jgi:threonine dehydrogenase-like Zn-dependent dehydrogenase
VAHILPRVVAILDEPSGDAAAINAYLIRKRALRRVPGRSARGVCGGNQFALHAEYNLVPRNRCVPVADNVSQLHAAFTTVGAIAMQGFRQSEAGLGETACVIGLGLVGQTFVQILRAAPACRSLASTSPTSAASSRRDAGPRPAAFPGKPSLERTKAILHRLSRGAGEDHVFLTAGGNTNQPVEIAPELARDRARVVDIGKCKLDLPWTAYYEKELDVLFSPILRPRALRSELRTARDRLFDPLRPLD